MSELLQKIYDYSLEEIMGERFGRYCKTIILDRALPDVRDGLKPVQRRILYAMYKSHNTYDKKYRKSAKAVGDIMGNYHPHGDSSIYDAMVRMSQDWKMMTPYIDMHGNNGSMDGDGAAAMRYTEARLAKVSNELLDDIDKNTVMMAPNYDDTLEEPTVLPAGFPNLLVNGSTGISAGYATNIPPHNLGEVIDATIKRIDAPNGTLDTIMTVMPGPDFPTGGTVEGAKQIKEAYQTGKGRIIVKSKYQVVKEKGKKQVIISEIPYEVNKANLVKRMNDIRIDKKVEGIVEVRDETSRGELRIVIELKKDADEELVINYLLKNTEMQVSYNFNMIAIVNRRPRQVGVLGILDAFISHRKDVVTRRTKFDLEHAKDRYHILEGLIKAISILDDVIRVIRASKNKADAIVNLVKEFEFTEKQATAIVMLQLYRLTNTDITDVQNEMSELKNAIKEYELILSDEEELKKVLKNELRKIKKEFSRPRLTEIKEEITEIKIDMTAMIPKEDVVVVVTNEGYVKRVSKKSYSSSDDGTLLKENDYVTGLYEQNTLDTLLLFTNQGNYLYVPVHELPELKWKELGKHVSNIIPIGQEERIIKSVPVKEFDKREVITFTKNGMVKKTMLEDFKVQRYSKPITFIKLKDNDEVINVIMSDGDEVFVATKKGYGLWYDRNEIPVIGLKTAGVKAINLKDDEVVSASLFSAKDEYVTVITSKGLAKRIKLSDFEKTSRAKRGLLLLREVKSNPQEILKVFVTNAKHSLVIKTSKEDKEYKLTEIPIMDRYSVGSTISKEKVLDVYEVTSIIKDEEKKQVIEPTIKEETKPKNDVSLKEIDDKFMTIDDFLDNFD
ncbi:MAG: DNA topoisomerase IV subunit A [Bacilli bacterium]|nr:DNA topoisomerase IV subunit A [Bacilli bacterium]